MNASARPFPWEETLGFLLGVLGWSPAAVWSATPREIALALDGRRGGAGRGAMDRAALEALAAAFPDEAFSPEGAAPA